MRVTLNAWPDKTPDFVSHKVMNDYIIDTSRKSGVHDATVFGAKVTHLEKVNEQSKWQVSWSELEDDGAGKVKELKKEEVGYTFKFCRLSAADQTSFLMQLWSHLDIIMLHAYRI